MKKGEGRDVMIELITQILLYISAIFMLIGAVGLFRFPDVYNRIHAATLVTVGGVCFFMIILAASNFWTAYSLKIILIVGFTLFSSPILSHTIAHTSYKLGIKPKPLVENEMKKDVIKVMKRKEEEL
jgi:multicomponent Na+:H+ antiporter subunit G